MAGFFFGCAKIVPMDRLLWLLGLAMLTGCVSQLPGPHFSEARDVYTDLVASSPIGIAPDEDVLELPPEVQPYIDQAIEGKSSVMQRVRALAKLFAEDGALRLEYQMLSDGTARETFESRRGSCLSYTHLYIAIARSLGIDARYREVVAVPQWQLVGDFVVLNRHVAAYGEVPFVGSYVMDFGLLDRNERQVGRVISDARARAQHFNNRGAYALSLGDDEGAIRYFNRALTIDPSLSFVWSNLGTTYIRLEQWQKAEQALRHALTLKTYETTALNQLGRLHNLLGNNEIATAYLNRSEAVRQQNPYFLFQRGVAAQDDGDYKEAIGWLRRAVRAQPEEVLFYVELGKAYRAAGEYERARRAFLNAHHRVASLEDRAILLDALGQPTTPPEAADEPAVGAPVQLVW